MSRELTPEARAALGVKTVGVSAPEELVIERETTAASGILDTPPKSIMWSDHRTSSRVIQVIETRSLRGDGQSNDTAFREVRSYWSFDGELLAEHDPLANIKTV